MPGFLLRLSGMLAALFTLNLPIGPYDDGTEWPWTHVGITVVHSMLALEHGGQRLGLDNPLRVRRTFARQPGLDRPFRALSRTRPVPRRKT